MNREFDSFLADIEFIKNHNDNWIFVPLYKIVRSLVMFYNEFYYDNDVTKERSDFDGIKFTN